jgi:glycosyltransferase involved in cell wall biosynthesis
MTIYPTGLHRAIARRQMHAALQDAAAVVMSTPEAVASVRRSFPDLTGKPILPIPNGYDASDFVGPKPARSDDRFRIVHTGYLHTELGLHQHRTARIRRMTGGQVPGVDLLTRSHVFLVKAIEGLLAEEPELSERLEVVFAGVLSETDRRIAERLSVARLTGYLPHAESVSLIRSADLLFLPMQKVVAGARATIVPGKTYEYLASGRPLLAAVPEGDARDLIRTSGVGSICDPDDVPGMMAIIRQRLRDGRVPSRSIDVRRYEYRELARTAASLLDDLAPGLVS